MQRQQPEVSSKRVTDEHKEVETILSKNPHYRNMIRLYLPEKRLESEEALYMASKLTAIKNSKSFAELYDNTVGSVDFDNRNDPTVKGLNGAYFARTFLFFAAFISTKAQFDYELDALRQCVFNYIVDNDYYTIDDASKPRSTI